MKLANVMMAGLLGLSLGLTGCASKKQVVIDPAGVDMVKYEQDLVECQQISEQVDQQAGKSAVGGAVVGGLMGAALGNGRTAERWAGAGAVGGAAKGASRTQQEKNTVVKNCMRNRGYSVLN